MKITSRSHDEESPLLSKLIDKTPDHDTSNDWIITLCLASATIISCILGGIVTISTPQIASDLNLSQGHALWPVTMFSLGTGCTLLICGALSDKIGCKQMFICGNALQVLACLACGFSQSGWQFITSRIISGFAAACCQPSAIGLVTRHFPAGKKRNYAMSCISGGQPVGFAIGVCLGGLFAEIKGWRWSFHGIAIISIFICILGYFQLPRYNRDQDSFKALLREIIFDLDWVGAFLAAAAMGLIMYSLAEMTSSITRIKDQDVLICLVAAIVLFPAFLIHEHRQENQYRPAMLKLSLWKNKAFCTICANIFLIWSCFNTFEQLLNLVFQNVQHDSPTQAALKFLPAPAFALFYNIGIGLVLHRFRAVSIISWTTLISSISTLILGLYQPSWLYWAAIFPALAVASLSSDAIFCVANTMIESIFPQDSWSLAAGIFNTISQLGKSLGLATTMMISTMVSEALERQGLTSESSIMRGLQAGFMFLFFCSAISLGLTIYGLQGLRKV